jgi:hypothetical protein
MAFGIGSLYSQRKAASIELHSRPDAELLATKNAALRDFIDKAAQVEVAKAQKDAFEAGERAGNAVKDAGKANERAAKAQGSLALAEQHSAEANAKAEGFRADIAKANASAEVARAQVASASAEAAKANLEVARIKSPRIVNNISTLTELLEPYKGTEYTFSSVFGDEESINLLRQIDRILSKSGWVRVKPTPAYPAIDVYGKEQDFTVAVGLTSNVKVFVNSDVPLATIQAMPVDRMPDPVRVAAVLAKALTDNIDPAPEGGISAGVEPGTSLMLRIAIGRKP